VINPLGVSLSIHQDACICGVAYRKRFLAPSFCASQKDVGFDVFTAVTMKNAATSQKTTFFIPKKDVYKFN
jgi:hypothetical protein